MKKSLVISEQDNIGAILENERVVEFFVNRGELLLGDIYTASVENILPGIDAAFVNLGKDKMGFLHANDVPGQGPLKERLVPKQKILVQITKEPTGHKGPRVSTAISLPGRFLVLVPEERGVSISRRISEARERARLKSVVNLMKPPGIGLIIRTEAKGQGEKELFEDFEQLWDRWQTIVSDGEASIGPTLIYRDQDLLYRIIRDAYSHEVVDIIVDTTDGQKRANEYLAGWAGKQTKISCHSGSDSLLLSKGIDKEIAHALSDRVELPSGGHLNIEPTEALTVIDVNSGRFTSSRTQAETVRRTNLEAAQEISRQLRLRNIGGMVIVDFIDMDSRRDQQQVLEVFQRALEEDRAKPQIGQLSDLGLVELTRRRQGQSLRELFTVNCQACSAQGVVPTLELGFAENRRVVTFIKKEDDLANKNRHLARKGQRQQGSILRAATAANGRIMPTLEESNEFDEVLSALPDHILEQMPDDLLEDKGLAQSKHRQFLDDNGQIEHENHSSANRNSNDEMSFEPSASSTSHNLEDDEFVAEDDSKQKFSDQLAENISAINEVEGEYRELSSSAYEEFVQSKEDTVQFPSQRVQESETAPETEFDPATGVYRLRTKPENVTAEQLTFYQPASIGIAESTDGETSVITPSGDFFDSRVEENKNYESENVAVIDTDDATSDEAPSTPSLSDRSDYPTESSKLSLEHSADHAEHEFSDEEEEGSDKQESIKSSLGSHQDQ
jgi:Rne/Rng family ribonuclease